MTSPTFTIIREYEGGRLPLYHFDVYRISDPDEMYAIGYEEYFYSGEYCFTEWTEKVEELLPEHYVRVEINENNGIRTIIAKTIDD